MTNVGSFDRTVRFIVGVILLIVPFLPATAGLFAAWGAWKFAIVVVGVVMLGTSLFRFCPAYALLGTNTCPLRKS